MADVVSLRGEPVLSPGEADPVVVEMLEEYLEMAKSGELVAAALAFQYRDGTHNYRKAGGAHEFGLIGAMETLKQIMIANRTC